MSGHRYTNSTNPFDDDDVDDDTFLRNSRHAYGASNGGPNSFDDQLHSYQEKRKQIEDRTIQSSERSIGILRDSEQIGIATAEELARQREQLERTDKRLDEINQTLRFSQKHINGIKSVFSSLKNYMSGRADQPNPNTIPSNNPQQSNEPEQPDLPSNQQYDQYENHPATRIRIQGSQMEINPSGSKQFSGRLEANLQEMSSSISRLKGLATDLSMEIDTQNDLIENITDKTGLADLTITRQNKDINKLLKK